MDRSSPLVESLTQDRPALLEQWLQELKALARKGLQRDADIREQCSEFLERLGRALAETQSPDPHGPAFDAVREQLTSISRERGQAGYTPSETALFVLSLKRPLFDRLRRASGQDAQVISEAMWQATVLLDRLALLTMEEYQRGREEVIARQQRDMLELSTPVVKLWEGILALPMIGTLDSSRTQVVMEALLQRIVETGSTFAILDITGVPTVDTLVAQHLLKTVAAARLMGADCIISGIRPQIAQTIVHLGVDLGNVTTKATLADAFQLALQRRGLTIAKRAAAPKV